MDRQAGDDGVTDGGLSGPLGTNGHVAVGFGCALSLLLMGVNHGPQARGMDSIHLFLALSHTLRHIAISSCVYVMGTVSI